MDSIAMASLTPIADLELLDGEYAALRPATERERRALGFKLRRKRTVYTIVLRSCAGIKAIVAETTPGRGPSMSAETIKSLVTFYSRNNETGTVISKSAAVIAFAMALFPSIETFLRGERPTSGPCPGCGCLWQAGGAFDRQSTTGRAVAAIVAGFEQRRAA
jgi:hypothetical protein